MKGSLSNLIAASLCIASASTNLMAQQFVSADNTEYSLNASEQTSGIVHILGSLSARWESGNRGPGTISKSQDDPGGVSYGTYQISTKHGYINDFLLNEGAQFCEDLIDMPPGTDTFNTKWKQIASENPTELHKAEHAFINRTHFNPIVNRLKNELDFHIENYSPVVRDAVWSTAVQHGPYTNVLKNAFGSVPISTLTEYQIIYAIYEERSKFLNGKMVYFPRIKDRWKDHLLNRFREEKKEALSKLNRFTRSNPTYHKPQQQAIASTESSQVVLVAHSEKFAPEPFPTRVSIQATVSNEPVSTSQATVPNQLSVQTQQTGFRVMLLVLDNNDYQFSGLPEGTVYLEKDPSTGFYKYFTGKHLTEEEAKALLDIVNSKGYSVGEVIRH